MPGNPCCYYDRLCCRDLLGTIALLTLFLGTVSLAYTLRVLSLLWLVLWLVCVVQAINGKRFKIPLLGSIAEKLAMK